MEKIVVAHSGGLDTLIAIPWLADRRRAEVVTVTLDLGQGRSMEDIHERALAMGAVRAHIIDARESFARDFVLPALRSRAMGDDRNPLVRELAQAAMAKHAVDIAHIEGARAIAFDGAPALLRALDASMKHIALPRAGAPAWDEAMDHARRRGVPLPASDGLSVEANLWGRVVQSPALNDVWQEAPEEIFLLTKSALDAPDLPAYVEIAFERSVPTSINGVEMPPVELIVSLETIAGAHGVGRLDVVEPSTAGTPSRVVSEAPAAVVLHMAHAELQRLVPDCDETTGVVRLRLYKGGCHVVGRRAHTEHVPAAPALALVGNGAR
jgi:argininosuccinate synthase